MKKTILLLALGLWAGAAGLRAELKLPAIIGDHMVLQHDAPCVWCAGLRPRRAPAATLRQTRAGGDAALQRVAENLQARFPGVETRHYAGAIGGSIRYLTKDILQRIAGEVDAVVGSTGD